MLYTPTRWLEDGMDAAAKVAGLNNAETQYAAMISLIDATLHDGDHYTQTESNLKYYPKSGGVPGLSAAKLGGFTLEQLLMSAYPPGLIMWSAGNAPSGWAASTGIGGKFMVGASPTLPRGNTGGSHTQTSSGTVTIASHAVTVAELPAHLHSWYDRCNQQQSKYATGSGYCLYLPVQEVTHQTGSTGGDQAHGHPSSTYSGNSVDIRPLYYVLNAWVKT